MKRRQILKIRKTHRYLGIFLGLQFIMWTISGLYFSWSNIDEIHGDNYKNLAYTPPSFENLISPSSLTTALAISAIDLRDIDSTPYYFINKKELFNAFNGKPKSGITEQEAKYIATQHMNSDMKIADVELISDVDKHHEYREKLLPAYVLSYESDNSIKAYVSAIDGQFQTVRHRDWRIFDFLWMTHTMDYDGRDDFNNLALRIFSALGLITVLSGFTLYFVTSPTFSKLLKRKRK
ncbi:hypothetical protein SAMN03097699_0479 [Flavobacteriaceae bacterium MAR_2010_188]|nr:hypothetical protein SAMN03097699_0479 [Flavobacteriaceae bacterium MAR_2010_188]